MIAAPARAPDARRPTPDTSRPIRLYDVQDDFVADQSRYPLFLAGRFAGKTYAGSVKAAFKCLEPGLGMIAAPDFPMLEFGAKRQFLERLDELGLVFTEQKSLGTVKIPETGAEVVFATLENEGRTRGPNYAWAWADEIEYLSRPHIWRTLKGAVRDGPHPQLFCTTTPKGRRLVWEEWVRDGDAMHVLYTATTHDNPFIDSKDYVASLGYVGQFYQQEIEAQFVAFEGLVYPEFHREQVRAVDCHDWPAALGLDFGSRSPTALLTLRHSGDRYHLEREVYRRGMTATEIKHAVHAEVERTHAGFVVADVNAGNITLELKREGIRIRDPKKQIFDGIAQVRSILPELTVDPQCVNTIAEFESYQYPEGGTVERDEPVKANDHAMDCLRYLCQSLAVPKRRVRFI